MKSKAKKKTAKKTSVSKTRQAAPSQADLNQQLFKLLGDFSKFDPALPKGLLLPALGGEPAAKDDAPNEPVYDWKKRATIQGNTIPGFNKDHQHFLFYRLGNLKKAKGWLRWIAPLISSMDDVLAFVRAHRAMRFRLGVSNPPMCATWVNIAFSNRAIAQLAGKEDAGAFGDQSFRQGLAERSTYLGDPTDSAHPGQRENWVVGGPKNEADILVIVAADDSEDLAVMADSIKRQAESASLRLLFEQRGDTLPGALRGHEHFGFKDGISQPGIRGKVSTTPGDFITPRYLDASDRHANLFAKPGQLLVWPGQFLLGEKRQNTEHLSNEGSAPAPAPSNFPRWAALGSYLVCRRLRQDVPAFWKFVIRTAATMGLPAETLATMFVGRWPSGAPLMRARTADNPALAGDEWANNHFIYDDNTWDSVLRPIPGYGRDDFTDAAQDALGQVCPHFAHIRKSNPRDSATDLGKPHDTALRLILRRGIPFGEPLVGVKDPSPKLIKQERGLMFISYGSTIEDQFEFITRRWVNSEIQPNFGGIDPLIGQRDVRGDRDRLIDIPLPGGGAKRFLLKDEWVIPTGGGYFFSPPIEAIAGVLGA